MPNTPIELMTKLEGLKLQAYDCIAGKRTIGAGFNMEQAGAKDKWESLHIKEDFDRVFNKEQLITEETANMLFRDVWATCEFKASKRCDELELHYSSMPDYKRFILADIVYNTGSISKWSKVLKNKKPEDVLFEARRNPKEIMDSRVAKIGYYFGIVKDLDEAHKLGLEHAKYLV